VKYAFIREYRFQYPVKTLCRVLKASRSSYYDWLKRPPSQRALANQVLLQRIQRVHKAHRGHSGALKTWRVLQLEGVKVGKHRVARVRQQHNIVARRRRRFVVTTHSKQTRWRAPNLLARNFKAYHPNRVWVGDVTFVPTREGWLFLAVLLDLYSRRVVGWSMSRRNDTLLTKDALDMAIAHRSPEPGLIHHTDQGQTYAAIEYRKELDRCGMLPSMSRKGDCWDNAVAESFFATLEFELIENRVFKSRDEAKSAIFEFIEVFYNRQRAHQTLEYKTPLQVDLDYQKVA